MAEVPIYRRVTRPEGGRTAPGAVSDRISLGGGQIRHDAGYVKQWQHTNARPPNGSDTSAPEALQAGGLKKFADNPMSKISGHEP